MENRNYAEKREIERIDGDLREATGISKKYFAEINRLKDNINSKDQDIRGFKIRVDQLENELD